MSEHMRQKEVKGGSCYGRQDMGISGTRRAGQAYLQGAGRRKWKDGRSVHVHRRRYGMAEVQSTLVPAFCTVEFGCNGACFILRRMAWPTRGGRAKNRKDGGVQCNANTCEVDLGTVKEGKRKGTGHQTGLDIESQPDLAHQITIRGTAKQHSGIIKAQLGKAAAAARGCQEKQLKAVSDTILRERWSLP